MTLLVLDLFDLVSHLVITWFESVRRGCLVNAQSTLDFFDFLPKPIYSSGSLLETLSVSHLQLDLVLLLDLLKLDSDLLV